MISKKTYIGEELNPIDVIGITVIPTLSLLIIMNDIATFGIGYIEPVIHSHIT